MIETSRDIVLCQNNKKMLSPSASNNDRQQVQNGHLKYVGKIPQFLTKTYDCVCYCDREHNDILSWTAKGDAFIVKDRKRLGSKILSQYFNHSNTASFYRQLNFYSFDKTTPESILRANFSDDRSDQVTYSHRFFKRDQPDLLPNIKRTTSPGEKKAACMKEVINMKRDLKEVGKKWRLNMDTLKRKLDHVAFTTNRCLDDLEKLISDPKAGKDKVELPDKLPDKPLFKNYPSFLSARTDDSFCRKIDTLPNNMKKLDRGLSCDSILSFPDIMIKPKREISCESVMSFDVEKIYFMMETQQEGPKYTSFGEDDLPNKPVKTIRDTTGEGFFSFMDSGEWISENKTKKCKRQTSCGSLMSISDILRQCEKKSRETSDLSKGTSALSRKTSDISRETSNLLDEMMSISKPSKDSRCTSKMWGIKSEDLDEKIDYGLMHKYLRKDKVINSNRSAKLNGKD